MNRLVGTLWADLRNVFGVLPRGLRQRLVLTAVLGLAAGLLEAVSVGAVVPLVVVLTGPDVLSLPSVARFIPQGLLDDRFSLVIAVAAAFALIFVAKTALALLVTMLQSRARGEVTARLASHLFAGYLRRPYVFHLQRDSADITTRLTYGVPAAGRAVHGLCQLIVECVALFGIGLFLFYVNAATALLTIAVIGTPAFFVYIVLRRHVRKTGTDMQALYRQATQATMESLSAIKELKVLRREADRIAIFNDVRLELSKLETRHDVLQATPRLLIELATVCAVLSVVSLLASKGNVSTIAPVLALYAAAAFRALPGANRILLLLQSIRHSEAGLQKVAEDVQHGVEDELFRSDSTRRLALNSELRLDHVSFSYGPGKPAVIQDLNLRIQAGECVGIAGPSGAGKTTLLDLILGILEPVDGRVLVDGLDIRGHVRNWQAGLGYVPQGIVLLNDTIRANVALGIDSDRVDEQRIWASLEAAQLTTFVKSLPDGLDTMVGERGARISGGERQRVGIARALYHDPDVLILDEATSALDQAGELELLSAVFALRGRKTIIVVAHRTTTIERCDRAVLLEGGRLRPMSQARSTATAR